MMNHRSTFQPHAHLPALAALFAAVLLLLRPAVSAAQTTPTALDRRGPVVSRLSSTQRATLGVLAGVGYLTSPCAQGAAANVGVRVGLGEHLALGLDYGWGLVSVEHSTTVQDRWWVMPSIALVIPAGSVKFDVGAGVGLATSSGYATATSFAAGPFSPDWAFQLVPAVRVHATIAVQVARSTDLFVQMAVGSLLLGGNDVGIRSRNDSASLTDTTWAQLWLGVHYRLM